MKTSRVPRWDGRHHRRTVDVRPVTGWVESNPHQTIVFIVIAIIFLFAVILPALYLWLK